MYQTQDRNHAIKVGLMITMVLIAYFLIMKLLGMAHHVELRALNGIILLTGLYLGIKHTKTKFGNAFSYETGWYTGLTTTLTTTVSFTLFIWLYIAVLNPSFLAEIQQHESLGQYITRLSIPIAIGIESLASGVCFTFIWLQLFKVSREKQEHKMM